MSLVPSPQCRILVLSLRYIWGPERLAGLFTVPQPDLAALDASRAELSGVCSGASPAALRPAAARRQIIPAALEGIVQKQLFQAEKAGAVGPRKARGSRGF